jgi:hypothetical protein
VDGRLSTQGIESRVSQKRRRKWERSPGIGAHIAGQQLMVASMAYVLRRSILPFGSEPAAKVALLALWMLMFFAVSCLTLASAEQGEPPARIGNIYGGLDHQPTQSEVQDRERAAGVGANTVQQQRNAATVDQLYEQLLGRLPADPAMGQASGMR